MSLRPPRRRPGLAALAVLALAGAAAAPLAGLSQSPVAAPDPQAALEAALAELPPDGEPLSPAEALRVARTRQDLLHRLGRYAEAQEAGHRWVALAEAIGDSAEEAAAHRATGRAYGAQGRDREATAHFRQALARLSPGSDPALEAGLLLDLASTLLDGADYAEAESLLRRVEGLWRAGALAGTPELEVRLWGRWGVALWYQGDPLGALDFHELAVAAAEALGDERLLITQLTNLAQVASQLHDHARSLALLERALALERQPRQRAIGLISKGIAHLELNQLSEAEAALAEGRRLAAEADHRAVEAWALGELGYVASKRGDAEAALALFERAVALAREAGDVRNEPVWWFAMGKVRRDQGRFEEALAFYERSLDLERRAGQPPAPHLRKHIGQCHAGLGHLEEAEAFLREALDLASQTGESRATWETQRELARLYRRTDRPDEAEAAYEAALAAVEAVRGSLRLPALKTDFFEDKVGIYAEAVDFQLARDGGAGARRAFEIAERARARAFLDSLIEARARLDEALPAKVLEEDRRLSGEISRLQARIRREGPTAELNEALAARERELEALALRARVDFPAFGRLRYPGSADLAAVQAALPPGGVLLAYFLADPASHLWIVRREGLEHRRLAGAAEIEGAVRAAYAGLLDPAAEPRLEALGRLLLGGVPLEPAPAALLVVPDGILHALPFEALPAGGRPLVEVAPTAYLPSASALVELAGGRQRPPEAAAPRLLALGDAVYGGAASSSRAAALVGLGGLGALPHTRSEVRGVAGEFGRGASTLLLGPEAIESRLKAQDLAAYSVLHLATHGWIDPASSARSGLVLGVEDGDEDGLLQFREILRLGLAADLVTLSACHTALGELITGEGMVGLARAFFHAGAPSVVASLWNVDDAASAPLMREFYRGLAAGLPKAEALRRARLALRADPRYRHPYYWAPFVLVGRADDGVAFPPRRQPVLPAALGLATAGALAVAAWVGVRRRRHAVRVGAPALTAR